MTLGSTNISTSTWLTVCKVKACPAHHLALSTRSWSVSTSADTSPGTLRAVPLLAQTTSGVHPQFCRGWTDVRQSVAAFRHGW